MQRRKFLTLIGLGATTATILPTIGFASISAKDAAVNILMNEFSYLTLDKPGVEQFVEDYLKYDIYTPHLDIKIKSYYVLGIKSNKSSVIHAIANKYLLSTDFFLNKMDGKQQVKYLGFYNPYRTPCSNPFSHIYHPTDTITSNVNI
jgi:hypothetical protein